MLSEEQIATLLRPINPKRVLVAQGQSHLPAFDVLAHLDRIFGFDGWDKEVVDLWLISEALEQFTDKKTKQQKEGWTVTYGCKVRITVRADGDMIVRDGVATGSANHLPLRGDAHDFAMKNADSYAVKRACIGFGDQFGLSLYNKGMTEALVKKVVGFGSVASIIPDPVDVPEPVSMGNDEREEIPTEDWVERETTVEPLNEVARAQAGMASQAQMAKLHATLDGMSHDDIRTFCGGVLMMEVDSLKLLTVAQMAKCIDAAEKRA
jgi:hypothetical protein